MAFAALVFAGHEQLRAGVAAALVDRGEFHPARRTRDLGDHEFVELADESAGRIGAGRSEVGRAVDGWHLRIQ